MHTQRISSLFILAFGRKHKSKRAYSHGQQNSSRADTNDKQRNIREHCLRRENFKGGKNMIVDKKNMYLFFRTGKRKYLSI